MGNANKRDYFVDFITQGIKKSYNTEGSVFLKVNIVDALMGTGKTSAIINHINQSDNETRYLYITPYLTEVNRVISKCPTKKFRQPESYGTKLNGMKYLLEKGVNIATTHALFQNFTQEIIDIAYNHNYVLVMDEVAEVIQPLDISKHDLETILEKYTEVVDGHLLKWTARGYDGEFEKYKQLCDLECVGVYNGKAIIWLFPVSIFKAFKEIYILTYLFKAQTQRYYYDLYGIEYKNLYISGTDIDSYMLTDEPVNYKYLDYGSLINICDNEKLNHIGSLSNSLSASWYFRNKDNVLMKTLKMNTINFFINHTKTKSKFNLWTTFKDYKPFLEGKGYTKGFLSSNMRATNDYKDRTAVAYLVNKFFNPHIKNFFTQNGIEIDEDAYALSEMIQFIWRSAIREGKEICLYCPSSRMRGLLQGWIKSISNYKNDERNKCSEE